MSRATLRGIHFSMFAAAVWTIAMTAADCVATKIGTSIASSAIGQPGG